MKNRIRKTMESAEGNRSITTLAKDRGVHLASGSVGGAYPAAKAAGGSIAPWESLPGNPLPLIDSDLGPASLGDTVIEVEGDGDAMVFWFQWRRP